MKAINSTYCMACLCWLIASLLSACTDDLPTASMESGEGGRLILAYTVGGQSVVTRAQKVTEEEGVEDRNENLVKTLDLFIFGEGDAFVRHISSTNQPLPTDPQPNENGYTVWDTGLSAADIKNEDQLYLIANAANAVEGVTSLEDLKEATVDGLVCNIEQESFVMDGSTIVTDEMWSNGDLKIPIDLARAAAKIRLSFSNDINWDEVSYRFYHYAATSSVIAKGEIACPDLNNFPEGTAEYPSEDVETEMAQVDPIEENGKQCLVLYSYANNWFDSDKEADMNVEPPIDRERETRILLRAPFQNTLYYYEVPVNFRLPDDNDAIKPDEGFKDLYRLQRNYLYDITVTIDGPGGSLSRPVTPTLKYSVVKWKEEEIEVPPFN